MSATLCRTSFVLLFMLALGCDQGERSEADSKHSEVQQNGLVAQKAIPSVPEISIPPNLTISTAGTFQLSGTSTRPALTVKVSNRDVASSWPEDEFVLAVSSSDGAVDISRNFTSSYGDFRIDLVDLTGDNVEEFVFVVGQGRGTTVRREHLSVEKTDGARFNQVLNVPISDYVGPTGRWWYDLRYVDVDHDGTTDLRLERDQDQPGESRLDLASSIPVTAVAEYLWDVNRGEMVLHRRIISPNGTKAARLGVPSERSWHVKYCELPKDPRRFEVRFGIRGNKSGSVTFLRDDWDARYDLTIRPVGETVQQVKDVPIDRLTELATVDMQGNGNEDVFIVSASGSLDAA